MDEKATEMSHNLIETFENSGKGGFRFIRSNLEEFRENFEEIMFSVKNKVEEKGYKLDYFIQKFDGETDTCNGEISLEDS